MADGLRSSTRAAIRVAGLVLTGAALVPSSHDAVPLSSAAETPVQIGFTPSGAHVIVTEKVSSSIDTFNVTSDGRLIGLHYTASTGLLHTGSDSVRAVRRSSPTLVAARVASARRRLTRSAPLACCTPSARLVSPKPQLAGSSSMALVTGRISRTPRRAPFRRTTSALAAGWCFDRLSRPRWVCTRSTRSSPAAGSSSSQQPRSRPHRSRPVAILDRSTNLLRAVSPQRPAVWPSPPSKPRRSLQATPDNNASLDAVRYLTARHLGDFRRMVSNDHGNPVVPRADDADLIPSSGRGARMSFGSPILVVEDDQTTCDVVRAYLESCGTSRGRVPHWW